MRTGSRSLLQVVEKKVEKSGVITLLDACLVNLFIKERRELIIGCGRFWNIFWNLLVLM